MVFTMANSGLAHQNFNTAVGGFCHFVGGGHDGFALAAPHGTHAISGKTSIDKNLAQRQGAYGAARARSTVRRLLRKYDSLAEDIRVPEIELPERFRVLGLGKRGGKKHEQNGNE